MSHTDEFKRTISFGEKAINQIKRNAQPAFPRNYEFWYTYSAGFNNKLNKAVNDALRTKGQLDTEEVDKLYEQFLSPHRISDRIDEVGSQLSDEISQVVSMIEASLGSASDFRTSLEGANDELSQTTDKDRIHQIVKSLIVASRENEDSNAQLERQLEDSRRQIDELKNSLETIRFESLTDELTTLGNRKHFDQSLERAVEKYKNEDVPFALLMTDIDHFKKFNDTYGHQTGDQVLRLVALAVKQNVKGQDIPCRYGGEEFAVILPNTNLEQATTVADHIRQAVMAKELVKRSTGECLGRVTISIGVATYHGGETTGDLIERTDACLYTGKRTGRNKVVNEENPDFRQGHKVA